MGHGLVSVWVCYQRENIELYFIMPMDNIAHCAHYEIYKVHFLTLILDGFMH